MERVENEIIKVMKDVELLNLLKITDMDILKMVQIAEKELAEIKDIVKNSKLEFEDLCNELGGHNLFVYEKDRNENYFDLNYKSLLVTIREKNGEYYVVDKGVYIYADNVSNVDIDEILVIDMNKEIDYDYILREVK